jgi:large subunit ribosomal protein LP1
MSSKKFDQIDATEKATLACTYAALILHADDQEIDGNKLNKLINGAGLKVDNFWPSLFAKTLASRNVADLLTVSGGDSGAAAPAAAPAADAGKAAAPKKEEPKKEAKKEEPKEEEEDVGMGGLFD